MAHNGIGYYVFCIITGLMFISYWICSLIYLLPDNYVIKKNSRFSLIYDNLFYQDWRFFAPPPQYNETVLYEFKGDNSNKRTICDAISPILANKQKSELFDIEAEALDYILMNSADDVDNRLKMDCKLLKKNGEAGADSILLKKASDNFNFINNALPSYQTLKNYGTVIADKNNLMKNNDSVRFYIIHQDIPKYDNRALLLQTKIKGRSSLIFLSCFFALYHDNNKTAHILH